MVIVFCRSCNVVFAASCVSHSSAICVVHHLIPACVRSRARRTLQYADSQVNKLEITAEKQYIAAAGNSQIRLFDVNSNDPQPVSSFDGHVGNVTAVGFQKDSKWMFSGAAFFRWRVTVEACHIASRMPSFVTAAWLQRGMEAPYILSLSRSRLWYCDVFHSRL